MRGRLALDQAADDLLREAGSRRVDDDHVGAPGLLEQRPDLLAGVAGPEAGVLDPVEAGVLLGVDDRVGDDLDPPDLAGRPRQAEAERPDPAEEVEDALARPSGPAISAAIP